MKKYGEETQTIYMVKKKVDCIICDVCGKYLYPRTKYYEVQTGHHAWGNDSIDSIKNRDICSDCLPDFVADYIRHHKNNSSDYIDIEAEVLTNSMFDDETVISKPEKENKE